MAAYEKHFFCMRKWRHGRIKDSEAICCFAGSFVGFEIRACRQTPLSIVAFWEFPQISDPVAKKPFIMSLKGQRPVLESTSYR